MSIVEITAVVFSLLSVILTIKNNIWCWPVGIIGIIFYMILFYQHNIFGTHTHTQHTHTHTHTHNMLLQTLFIVQSIFGWYNWNKPSKYPIKWLSGGSKESVLGITGLLIVLFSIIIKNKGGHSPYLDGTTTALSVVAMLLMAYRKIESWILWIIADIIFIIFFYINELYLSSGIYSVFLILAILGLFEWKKSIKTA